MDHKLIYLIHILFVAPLLIYAAYVGRQLSTQCSRPDNMTIFNFLGISGIVVLLYHIYMMTKLY
jgi:hypothetical protein